MRLSKNTVYRLRCQYHQNISICQRLTIVVSTPYTRTLCVFSIHAIVGVQYLFCVQNTYNNSLTSCNGNTFSFRSLHTSYKLHGLVSFVCECNSFHANNNNNNKNIRPRVIYLLFHKHIVLMTIYRPMHWKERVILYLERHDMMWSTRPPVPSTLDARIHQMYTRTGCNSGCMARIYTHRPSVLPSKRHTQFEPATTKAYACTGPKAYGGTFAHTN